MKNADISVKFLFWALINFENLTENNKDINKNQLFSKIKNAFSDFRQKEWYNYLSDSEKIEFDFIASVLNQSNSYSEFKEKLQLEKKKKTRAERLLILLDVYKKGFT
jgi:hypothetical protein